jgi:hypothetical protein
MFGLFNNYYMSLRNYMTSNKTLLTPWSGDVFKKLIVSYLFKTFPVFMESEASLPHSSEGATGPCPESTEFRFEGYYLGF